jgi:hypothetical protein
MLKKLFGIQSTLATCYLDLAHCYCTTIDVVCKNVSWAVGDEMCPTYDSTGHYCGAKASGGCCAY